MKSRVGILLTLIALGLIPGPGARTAFAQTPGQEGVIVIRGTPQTSSPFDSIQWTGPSGGVVIDHDGDKIPFLNSEIGRVIYFDQAYYDEVDHNQYWVGWRAGVQDREVVLTLGEAISLSNADLPDIRAREQVLQNTIASYSTSKPYLGSLLACLQDQEAKLASGLVLRNGKWMTQHDADAMVQPTQIVGDGSATVTFTTKDGRTFANAKVTVTDTGVSALTADGGGSVSFDQLPGDLSVFPPGIRRQIIAATGGTASAPSKIIPGSAPGAGFFNSAGSPPAGPAVATANAAPGVNTTDAVVVIKGDYTQGTGFLTRTAEGPAVITNLHVVARNPNLKIYTSSGAEITPLSMQGASDRDLAMFLIQDNNYSYLPLSGPVEKTAQVNDATNIFGNSEGGGVTLKTEGKLLAIGPKEVEFSKPVFHGNSGGPVFDTRSGNVIGVASFAAKVVPEDEIDRNSLQSANSAIQGPIRYFGWRLDNIPAWEHYDRDRFVNEGLFLKDFNDENLALDVYMNGKDNAARDSVLREPPGNKFYQMEKKLSDADYAYRHGQTAARELVWLLGTMSDDGYNVIQNPYTFYPYNQELARRELNYRDHLKTKISATQSKLSASAAQPGL